ncbi:hypothetical protein VLK31_04685 [Variovorax sp. H27-G14]|uniref:hypothetical protein n=1 Tax=Variovorax sp. H27-G14 TaxID=3111914 RepID=UPI0038FCF269
MTVPFVLLLAACAVQPKPPAEADALPPPVVVPRVMPVEAEPRAPATQPASLFTLITQGPVAAMLSYADKMRSLNGGDLSAEISRLGDPGDSPTTQMQLALLLSQTRVPADLARALGLMQRVVANPSPEAQPLQPLARALAARYVEQRRVEDDRDKQVQQLRDSQRRIDQLNDRIEALRAIERSFARPNMAPAAPAAPNASKPTP